MRNLRFFGLGSGLHLLDQSPSCRIEPVIHSSRSMRVDSLPNQHLKSMYSSRERKIILMRKTILYLRMVFFVLLGFGLDLAISSIRRQAAVTLDSLPSRLMMPLTALVCHLSSRVNLSQPAPAVPPRDCGSLLGDRGRSACFFDHLSPPPSLLQQRTEELRQSSPGFKTDPRRFRRLSLSSDNPALIIETTEGLKIERIGLTAPQT